MADPLVRIEAARLREKLREYYEADGQSDPIRIELPKGGTRRKSSFGTRALRKLLAREATSDARSLLNCSLRRRASVR